MRQNSDTRPVIAIGGAVGSGKSTLAARVGGCVISTDHYLPNYDEVPELQRDEPEHADLDRLHQDLLALRERGETDIPTWCFQAHRRIGTSRARAESHIVCEGIFALHPKLIQAVDVRVLVRASSSTRWGRWEDLERRGERGMGVEQARAHFESVAEPTYARHAPLYERGLDYIVLNDQTH